MKTCIENRGIVSPLVLVALFCLVSCQSVFSENEKGQGSLSVRFADGQFRTKVAAEIPDSNSFLLSIKDNDGNDVYDGTFGKLPQNLIVDAGTYNVSVRSSDSVKPAFSAPVYGDDQCVIVPPGGVGEVVLVCSQLNSGIRLRIEPNFLTSFPKGVLFVKSTEGRLMYSYSEKRIAYFQPGEVSLLMDDDGQQSNLLTRSLAPKEILTVGISAPAPSSGAEGIGNIRISIDTSRTWTDADLVLGENNGGTDLDNALDVGSARAAGPCKGVWVYGYIVGTFRSSGNIQFEEPFTSSTNCAISGRQSPGNNDSCLSVELKKGELRDVLNLMDHPENLGKKVFLKGELVESYYGLPGVKNITDFVLK